METITTLDMKLVPDDEEQELEGLEDLFRKKNKSNDDEIDKLLKELDVTLPEEIIKEI